MSSSSDDEKKELVEREPGTVVETRDRTTTRPVYSASPVEHRESVVHHRSTNTGAIVAIAVGIVVLLGGLFLVYSQIAYIPWPWSIIVVVFLGLVLIGVGAKLINTRTTAIAA